MKKLIFLLTIIFSLNTAHSQVYPPDSLALRLIYEAWYDSSHICNSYLNNSLFIDWCLVGSNTLNSNGRVLIVSVTHNYGGLSPNSYLHSAIGELDELEFFLSAISSTAPNLSGTIPFEIGNLTKLKHLQILRSNMYGSIPTSVNNLVSLERLELQCIQGSTHRFSGVLPLMNNLNKLQKFILIDTDIRGNIPGYFGILDSLKTIIFVSNPLFGGELNDSLCLSNTLNEIIIIDCPMFYGKIPDCFGGNYIGIRITGTNLTDTIPSTISNISRDGPGLSFVYLNNNKFTAVETVYWESDTYYYTLQNNKIQFGCFENSLVALGSVNKFNQRFGFIHPQDSMWHPLDTTIAIGSDYILDSRVSGQYNTYWWYKDSVFLGWNTTGLWEIINASVDDVGLYNCKIRNDYITPIKDLILDRHHIIVRVDSLVTAPDIDLQQPVAYPVPFNENIKINNLYFNGSYYTISIISSEGKEVFGLKTNKSFEIINTESFPKGAYFIRILQGSKAYSYKVFKE